MVWIIAILRCSNKRSFFLIPHNGHPIARLWARYGLLWGTVRSRFCCRHWSAACKITIHCISWHICPMLMFCSLRECTITFKTVHYLPMFTIAIWHAWYKEYTNFVLSVIVLTKCRQLPQKCFFQQYKAAFRTFEAQYPCPKQQVLQIPVLAIPWDLT